jgi:hypothetical protein
LYKPYYDGFEQENIQRQIRELERACKRKEVKRMNINDFAVKVAKKEGKKKQISIAQIKEVLKIVNRLLDGDLYDMIRGVR